MPADGKPRIAFQGKTGAHSHTAALEAYPDAHVVPCETFEDCFATVAGGGADTALIPVENSIAGRVADIHRLLPGSGLHVVGEHFARIRHHLLVPKGGKLEDVKVAASHFHALSQCRRFLADRGIEPFLFGDTAGAAEAAAREGDPARGAIASELAAGLYGLDVAARDIEDAEANTTRFLLLAAEAEEPDPDEPHVITTLVFRVRHIPSALYKALGGFATNRVNILKLESSILDGSFESAEFYADMEGHPAHRNVALALEELGFFSRHVQVLGVYRAADFRRRGA